VRYPYGDYDRSLDPETMAVTCPEEDIVGVITAKDLAKLQGNAEVIDALENIYRVTCVKFTIFLSDSHEQKIHARQKDRCVSGAQPTGSYCIAMSFSGLGTPSTNSSTSRISTTRLPRLSDSARLRWTNIQPTNCYTYTPSLNSCTRVSKPCRTSGIVRLDLRVSLNPRLIPPPQAPELVES
jgi:hypothetical protein